VARVANSPDGARALRRRLVTEGARLRPSPPESAWQQRANRSLQGAAEIENAVAEVHRCGLPPHEDRPKNWDLLVALSLILEQVPRTGAVLDMGATLYSRVLPWLYLYGYRRLHGIDLVHKGISKAGPIRYQQMDLTRTTFASCRFDAITSLSVIEHGVDFEAYLREASRLLRPGGLLVTSTDYWSEPVDTRGQVAYGVPITVLQPIDLDRFVELAAAHGLSPTGSIDLSTADRAVTWQRFDLRYTFANIVLRRDL
jgi:SAM-dependent methyltransferase